MCGKMLSRYAITQFTSISWVILMAAAFRPEGYIVQVQSNCSYDQTGEWTANITVLADHTASSTGICEGRDVDFNGNTLLVSYGTPVDDGKCYFKRVFGLYRIDVAVALGKEMGIVEIPAERYTVTCVKSASETKATQDKIVAPPLISPKELQTNKGKPGSEKIMMAVVDVEGRPIREEILFGQKIRLKAAIRHGLTYGQGFKVVSCDAIGTKDQSKYAILRGGCGDGLVIPSTIGFVSDGYYKVISPVFEMFQIVGSHSLVFKCNFTICSEKCIGSSCFREYNSLD